MLEDTAGGTSYSLWVYVCVIYITFQVVEIELLCTHVVFFVRNLPPLSIFNPMGDYEHFL